MILRERVEALCETQGAELVASESFRAFERGAAAPADYDRFLADVVRTHLKATEYVAFLCALAAPATSETASATSSRSCITRDSCGSWPWGRDWATGCSRSRHRPPTISAASWSSRCSTGPSARSGSRRSARSSPSSTCWPGSPGRIAAFLAAHRGLGPVALRFSAEHADVDVQHAAEGLEDLETYAAYYGLADEDGLVIAEMTLRENAFLRRYFRTEVPTVTERTPCGS